MNKITWRVAGFFSTSAMFLTGSSRAAVLSSSHIYATVDQTYASANVTSLPYVTPVTASDANATSISTPDFTSTTLKTTFSQTATAAATPISGESLLSFTAAAGDTYSVFGSTVPAGGTSNLEIQLFNTATQKYVYHDTDGTVLAGTSTGSLIGGDLYDFLLSDSLYLDTVTSANLATNAVAQLGSNTGSGGVTILPGIVVPEPTMVGAIMLIGGGMLAGRRKRATA